MGYKNQTLSKKHYKKQTQSYKSNLQCYYSKLYDQVNQRLKHQGHRESDIQKTILSIFTRTKIPTKTHNNRLLQLLDVDKIISINSQSLKQNSQQIKHMRMVASLKHQQHISSHGISEGDQTSSRAIDDLVRLARLHMLRHLSRNRREGNVVEDSDDQGDH